MRKPALKFAILIFGSTLLLGSCDALQMLQKPDDKAIVSEIQAKLFADPVLKTRDIRVTSEKGVVTLAGAVGTDLEKGAAKQMAGQVKGVKQVIDELMVGPAPAAAAPAAETPAQTAAASPAPSAAPSATRPAERPKPARRAERAASAAPEPERKMAAETAPAPPVRQPEQITIPSGTVITVRMIDSIDSAQNRPGEEFAATVDAPVVVDERVVIRRGADARVRLIESRSAGRMTGRSELEVELVGLAIGGHTYAVESGAVEKVGASRGKRTAATVGGGAALGGLIGAIAGKGKGAAIGAAVGAGAGTAVQASTRGQQIQIPSETKLDFTLKAPITVTM